MVISFTEVSNFGNAFHKPGQVILIAIVNLWFFLFQAVILSSRQIWRWSVGRLLIQLTQ